MTDILTPTLPGAIPGLLRRGSPVFYRDEESSWTVLCIDGDEVCAAPVGEVPLGLWGMCDDFTLDLTDATGRAHATWFLARSRVLNWSGRSMVAGWEWCESRSCWTLTLGQTFCRRDFRGNLPGYSDHRECLADLDPDDPRTLPDGSRWVDAEALRRICLHVAEVANA